MSIASLCLEQFAIMGDIYSHAIFGIRRPRVGLLSIGEEDSKGNELTRKRSKTSSARRSISLNVEGRDIFKGSRCHCVRRLHRQCLPETQRGLIETFRTMLGQELQKTLTARLDTSSLKMHSTLFAAGLITPNMAAHHCLESGITIVCHGVQRKCDQERRASRQRVLQTQCESGNRNGIHEAGIQQNGRSYVGTATLTRRGHIRRELHEYAD